MLFYKDHDVKESSVPFYEHIFLDEYLDQFPKIEPIQQFMTLVLNGISRNSFLKIEEKKEIIEWYKNYFIDKLDIIQESLKAEQMEQLYQESLKKP